MKLTKNNENENKCYAMPGSNFIHYTFFTLNNTVFFGQRVTIQKGEAANLSTWKNDHTRGSRLLRFAPSETTENDCFAV